jgi:Chitinase A, N-terminal domain
MMRKIYVISLPALLVTSLVQAMPAQPMIDWTPAQATVAPLTVKWNMWWGENGNKWSLIQNGQTVCNQVVSENSPNPQQGSCNITLASGANTLTVKLCNLSGCNTSPVQTVTLSGDAATTIVKPPITAFGKIAPFVDATLWPVFDLAAAATETGIKHYTLGFITAKTIAQCTPAWGSYYEMSDKYLFGGINKLRQQKGDVMISFGGAANSELATVCSDTAQLVSAYRLVINTYKAKYLDFDIEGAALLNTAANQRRALAIAQLQQQFPNLKVWFTLPATPKGLTPEGIQLLQQALQAGVNLRGVNIMAMDYGDWVAPNPSGKMGYYAIQAAKSLFTQLKSFYPTLSIAGVWNKIGVTPMIGINDVSSEIFTLKNAQELATFGQNKKLGLLAFWSANRDAPCPNNVPQLTCSGVIQQKGDFSKTFFAIRK